MLDSRTNEYVLAAKTTVSPDGNSVVLEVPAGVNAVGVRNYERRHWPAAGVFLFWGLFFATVHVDVRACVDAHSAVHESRGVYVCSTLLARTYHHTRV